MHALKEQQRLSFEQHAHVLAVLQEQGRQLQGLLIDRDNKDKQELENAMLKESIAVLDTETAKLERCMRQSGIFKEQQELAHATESLFLARARSLSHVNNRQTLQY
jgi:Tfp pilus assembly protein PilN